MYGFLTALLILDSLVLAVAVLLQAGKGGGLAASFGGAGSSPSSLLGSREAGNLLTKASWWTGGIFLGLSFVLYLMSGSDTQTRSILDQPFSAPATQSPPIGAPLPGGTQALPLQPVTPPPAGGKADTGKQP
jgi:preprotein translocase subunit SecG